MLTTRPVRTSLAVVVASILFAAAAVLATGSLERDPDGAALRPARVAGPPPAAPTPSALRPYTAGAESSPLHLVEYGDYGCPACIVTTADPSVNRVLDRWIASGRLRLTWRFDATRGGSSELAARAAHAAARQDVFFRMHFALFGAALEGRLPTTRAGFVALARAVSIPDLGRFRRDLTSSSTIRFVRRSAALAARRRITSAPSFASDGTVLERGAVTGRRLERRLRRLYRRVAPDDTGTPADPAAETLALVVR